MDKHTNIGNRKLLNLVTVKGPKGQLEQQIDERIKVEVKENEYHFPGVLMKFRRPADMRAGPP